MERGTGQAKKHEGKHIGIAKSKRKAYSNFIENDPDLVITDAGSPPLLLHLTPI